MRQVSARRQRLDYVIRARILGGIPRSLTELTASRQRNFPSPERLGHNPENIIYIISSTFASIFRLTFFLLLWQVRNYSLLENPAVRTKNGREEKKKGQSVLARVRRIVLYSVARLAPNWDSFAVVICYDCTW